jgi:pimeloyl-ACP methyl ester carboxylesterase
VRLILFAHDHGRGFDPDPAETSRRDIEIHTSPPPGPFSAVGWRHAGLAAAASAASNAPLVDRLVLCCVPASLDTDLDFDPRDIRAKTLLLYGQADPDAPFRHARWWKDHIADARVEMFPGAGGDLSPAMWRRALSHAAPRTLR